MSATTDPTGWTPPTWKTIQDGVKSEMDRSPIRKILDVSVVPNADNVPINFVDIIKDTFTVTEDLMPLVELYATITVTKQQVQHEMQLHTVANVAKYLAHKICQAETRISFQGMVPLPKGVESYPIQNKPKGLLNQATHTTNVKPLQKPVNGDKYGVNTYNAVIDAIAKLQSAGHGPPLELVLPTELRANTFALSISGGLASYGHLIEKVVSGFHGTDEVPANQGLLISRYTAELVIGEDAKCEYLSLSPTTGQVSLRIFERMVPVDLDNTGIVEIKFQ